MLITSINMACNNLAKSTAEAAKVQLRQMLDKPSQTLP